MVSTLYCELIKADIDSGSIYAVQGDDIFNMLTHGVEKDKCMELTDKLGLQFNTENCVHQ